jgi:hypothetical protein
MTEPLLIAKAKQPIHLLPKMANRHGLIAAATGTGKTVTLQVMAERFSSIGVPLFMADVKGDLSGMSQPGSESPVTFWDLFGEKGHPIRTTISENWATTARSPVESQRNPGRRACADLQNCRRQ